ncbi:MAG: phosphoribosylformylglycinamidine cyclo-ligase [Candidatus Omnitrophota bacterium]
MKYKESGVDIDASQSLVEGIKRLAKKTKTPRVLGEVGLFAGCLSFPVKEYQEPVLVSGTDGVGTKILLAELLGRYDTIGIDLVAMSVNDILTCGARPLFFLDYLAVGRIKREREMAIIRGVVQGCRQAGCALLGGETAQMADVYGRKGFDLAGFAVGAVERSKIIDGKKIKKGDIVLGLPGSGLHSNGFSLVRKIFTKKEILSDRKGLGAELLKPTRIYVKIILETIARFEVKGLAHITGGGLVENIPRILPKGTKIVLDRKKWKMPGIFQMVQEKGKVSDAEMSRTFNLGIGMVMVASPFEAEKISRFLEKKEERFYQIGRVEKSATAPGCDIKP